MVWHPWDFLFLLMIDDNFLLDKLDHYGIRGCALSWFKSYLSRRLQCVTYNGSQSSQQMIKCGVPQGSILGLLLFLIYINDLCIVCKITEPVLFAEDTNLFSSGSNAISRQDWVNNDLAIIAEWLKINKLSLKFQKSSSRCNKNTWHVESSYILQTPKYLLLSVNRFRYINNNVTKYRCPIPMDTTVWLGPLKFSLRATIDNHGPSILSGHYTASINCCKKHSIATITQLRGLELLITKTPLLHMLYHMNWLTHDFWTRTGGWEFDRSHGAGTSSPSHWQQVEEQAPKPVGWMMCFLLMTWWPWFPSRSSVLNIYIYICIPYRSSVIGRIYIYIYIYIYTTGVSFGIGEAAPHHALQDCISG